MEPEELRALLKKAFTVGAFFAAGAAFYALRWRWALMIYLVAVSVVAVMAILIQSGRGGGLAASLGGLGGDALLGARSATPIAKATYVMLALFLFLCCLATRMGPETVGTSGLLDSPAAEAPSPAPLAPAPTEPLTVPQTPAPAESPAPPGGPAAHD